jgi:pimeloyl-ACP methyl ester carboxylesterase
MSIAFLMLAVVGCASPDYITMRKVPHNRLAGPLKLFSFSGPEPSPRTLRLLRRFALSEEEPNSMLVGLDQQIGEDPQPEKLYSYSELAYIEGQRALAKGQPTEALEYFGAAVTHAYWYLFDPKFDHFRNPYDPQFRQACDVYNGSLEAVLRIVKQHGDLRPDQTYTIKTNDRTVTIVVEIKGNWHDDDFQRLEFASDFEITGLNNRHQSFGLGVPLVAVRKSHDDEDPTEKYYPPGLSFAATAFLRVFTLPPAVGQSADAGGHAVCHCVLELHDPLVSKDILVDGRRVPLETDLTTPLAYFLDNPDFEQRRNVATLALLTPDKAESLRGFFMVEPYDPKKIPVVMVHGLWSSPLTWMEMFNDLRAFPEIRDQYQFWFYLYPTGQPFWISAAEMRKDLEVLYDTLDPIDQFSTLHQMVLVGHSMGGLISKLQTLESGNDFWQLLSDQPIDDLQGDRELRERLEAVTFFEPNPSIRRVITIATPHRGSEFSNDFTRWLARKLIWLPQRLVSGSTRLYRDHPDMFRDAEWLTFSTSIDSLAPDSPVLPVMLRVPKSPRTKYHNIVGLIPQKGIVGRLAARGDGIVEFDSAHLDDVASEISVAADHVTVHQHSRTILEVRRILLEHQRQALAEMQAAHSTMPASFSRRPADPPTSPILPSTPRP